MTVAYREAKLFAAAGHFPGLGSASQPVGEGPANVGLSGRELERADVVPFKSAIQAGVPGIVVSNGLYAYDDFVTPATLSRRVTTGLLRGDLGFKGVALTGDLTDPAVTALEPPAAAAVQAVRAGADLLYLSAPPAEQAAAYRAVLAAVRKKRVSAAAAGPGGNPRAEREARLRRASLGVRSGRAPRPARLRPCRRPPDADAGREHGAGGAQRRDQRAPGRVRGHPGQLGGHPGLGGAGRRGRGGGGGRLGRGVRRGQAGRRGRVDRAGPAGPVPPERGTRTPHHPR